MNTALIPLDNELPPPQGLTILTDAGHDEVHDAACILHDVVEPVGLEVMHEVMQSTLEMIPLHHDVAHHKSEPIKLDALQTAD